jgi:hypothetical protein
VGFGKGKFNAKRFAKFGEFVEEEGNARIGEYDRHIINNGGGVGLGAKDVIISLLIVETSEFRSFMKQGIDLLEGYEESESGE